MSATRVCFLLVLALGLVSSAQLPVSPVSRRPLEVSTRIFNRHQRSLDAIEDVNAYESAYSAVNSGPVCRWNKVTNECLAGYHLIGRAAQQSSDPYVKFVARFPFCEGLDRKKHCEDTRYCSWDSEARACTYYDVTVGQRDSACFSSAAGTITGIAAEDTCSLHRSALPCFRDRRCYWKVDDPHCESDEIFYYIGVRSTEMRLAAEPIIDSKFAEVTEKFPSFFDITDPKFSWESVLEWDIPATSCPEWADELFCAYADGYMTSVAPSYYCENKYASSTPEECNADPYCNYDKGDAVCTQHPASLRRGVLQAIYNVAEFFEHAIDKELMQKAVTCVFKQDEEACTEPCTWYHRVEGGGLCRITQSWGTRLVSQQGPPEDAFCEYSRVEADSGCLDILDPYECHNNPNCRLKASGTCASSVDHLVDSALEKDKKFKKLHEKLQRSCSLYDTELSCN